jgi:hypothetical protein
MMLFDPRWVRALKGNYVVGRSGRHGRKLKLKENEPENGHIALRMKQSMKLQVAIYGLNFASRFSMQGYISKALLFSGLSLWM